MNSFWLRGSQTVLPKIQVSNFNHLEVQLSKVIYKKNSGQHPTDNQLI